MPPMDNAGCWAIIGVVVVGVGVFMLFGFWGLAILIGILILMVAAGSRY